MVNVDDMSKESLIKHMNTKYDMDIPQDEITIEYFDGCTWCPSLCNLEEVERHCHKISWVVWEDGMTSDDSFQLFVPKIGSYYSTFKRVRK